EQHGDYAATKGGKEGRSEPFPDLSCAGLAGPAFAETMISQTAPVSAPKLAVPPAAKRETVLTTDQLVKIYGGRAVVDGINMHVGASEIVGLLGPNGAGKTTSFYMIVGLVRPNSGRVIFSETDVTDYPMYKRARQIGRASCREKGWNRG